MAHDPEAIMAGLVTKLTTDQTAGSLYEAVSGRVYRTEAPPDATEPLLVVSMIDDPVDNHFSGTDVIGDVAMTVWGDKGVSETTVRAIVKKLLAYDGTTFVPTGFGDAQLECVNRGIVQMEDQRVGIITTWALYAH